MFCSQPFNRIEIYENGDVFNCCPPFVNYYSIGNIFKSSFDEIWNGDKVKELREKLLKEDFSLCADICNRKFSTEENNHGYTVSVNEYPEEISISSDNTCNVCCRICREHNYTTKFNKETLNEEVENIWLPIFKNAKLLRFGCSGEPFASYKETLIIKKTAQKYGSLKFHFHTNGILADEQKLKELCVYDRIDTITVSLHSASRGTYNKIIRGGNYDKVMQNLKLYSKMKKENLINHLRMIFVVYDENYKEMPKFVKLAQKHNAAAEFWALRLTEGTEISKNFDKHSIINPKHKEYKNLVKILKQPLFNSPDVILYPELKNLTK
ncbi:MAG: radical SAM protein [Candidatus Gastranaerophilales bacterium]|nr:radical SAM protein [Candidatus Gastranaerophilales bacterium]